MKLRADQLLMGAVVGLGAYAVYRLARASSGDQQGPVEAPTPAGPHVPIPGEDSSLPMQPTVLVVPPPEMATLGGSRLDRDLRQGIWYRIRLETYGSNPPFSPDSPREALQAGLGTMGFGPGPDGVLVFVNADEARAAGYPEWALAGPGRGTRWATARWAKPTQPYQRPPAFQAGWATHEPGL